MRKAVTLLAGNLNEDTTDWPRESRELLGLGELIRKGGSRGGEIGKDYENRFKREKLK